MLAAAVYGLKEPCELAPVVLEEMKGGRSGLIRLAGTVWEGPCWVCVTKAALVQDDGIYCFELVGCRVLKETGGPAVAEVLGYLETGAHGVIETRSSDGQVVLVPLVDEFVEFRLEERVLIIKAFDDFVV